MKRSFLVSCLSFFTNLYPPVLDAQEQVTHASDAVEVQSELGVLGVIHHRIMYSRDQTHFDYVKESGQDNLDTFHRYTAEMRMNDGDRLRFVYQPLELRSRTSLKRDILVDEVPFAAGTPMQFVYSFPYYRGTWLWETMVTDRYTLHLGLALQIRNARTEFMTLDGDTLVSNRGLGPVPLLALALNWRLNSTFAFEFEAEGNPASSAIFHGDDQSETTGALIDTSLKLSSQINPRFRTFASLRYISAGSRDRARVQDNPASEGFSGNWMDLAAITLGLVANLDAF
ncbi:hypothetical protein [Oligoflexus tunisiensis]|uniref:hypothetical protein n=1 Tax=Oligoflexus tunisiensis TaxID=708132 RepID=UPI00114CAAFE|nr:hypothetical protein [Oligoflexus tunisiensis]